MLGFAEWSQSARQGGDGPTRCAIYTRVSTDEQAMREYSSLKRQEEICRNYVDIQAEKGWKAVGVYGDGVHFRKRLPA